MAATALATLLGQVMAAVGLPVLVGPQHLTENDAPGRIVWVPSQDELLGAVQGTRNAKSVMTRWTGFEVHVWGGTYDAARELARQLLVAMHATWCGSHRVTAARWLGFDRPAWLEDGEVWIASVAVQEPINKDDHVRVVVETVDFAPPSPPPVQGDGLLDATENT